MKQNKIQAYVLGFLFSYDYRQVVLIEKQKPDWQLGFLNGVGGKIEKIDLNSVDAMKREFKEETGMIVDSWDYFAELRHNDWIVFCYKAIGDVNLARTMEKEEVYIINLDELPSKKILSNLNWLIPLATSKEVIESIFYY